MNVAELVRQHTTMWKRKDDKNFFDDLSCGVSPDPLKRYINEKQGSAYILMDLANRDDESGKQIRPRRLSAFQYKALYDEFSENRSKF